MKKNLFLFLILLLLCLKVDAQCPTSAVVCTTGTHTSNLTNPLTTNGWGGNTVRIEGTLIVDNDFTFSNCDILMQPYAVISINADVTLTLDNVHIHSCDGITGWSGIQLYNASNMGSTPVSLDIIGGTVIEDAWLVVEVTGNSGIRFIDSQLNKCFQGIFVDITAPNSTFEMYNSEITCSSDYTDIPGTRGPCLLSPWLGTSSVSGVIIADNNNTIQIGDPNHGQNLFDNIGAAIEFQRSDFIVQNNKFDYCIFGVECTGYLLGSGWTNTYDAKIGGNNSNEKNEFYNTGNSAILVWDSYNAYIYSNEIYDCTNVGIRFQNATTNSIDLDIDGNITFNTGNGIYLVDCWKVNDGQISWNHINDADNLTYVNLSGITVTTFGGNYVRNLTIDNNDVWNCETGIYADNLKSNCLIVQNTVNIPDNIPANQYIGLDILLSEKTKVVSNEVHRYNDDVSTTIIGIRGIDMTYTDKFSLNYLIDHTSTSMTGIQLLGDCSGLQLECNEMIDCDMGMELGGTLPVTMAPEQGSISLATQNSWYPLNCTNNIRVAANTSVFDWYYDGTAGANCSNQLYPQTNNFNINLATVTSTGNVCGLPLASNFIIARDVDPIIYETIAYPEDYKDYTDALTYISKSNLFRSFLINHEDWMEDGDYKTWYDNLFDENIGKLARTEKILFEPTTDDIENGFEDADNLLSSITPSNTIEEYKLFVLSVILNIKTTTDPIPLEEIIGPEDITTLETIACQDPTINGNAVIFARRLLGFNYDYEGGCEEERLGKRTTQKENNNLSVYPNPTSGLLQVIGDSNIDLEIFDTKGSIVKSVKSISNKSSIDLGLPIGVYSYKISLPSTNQFKTGKLVIIN